MPARPEREASGANRMPTDGPRVLMAGEVVEKSTLLEILNVVQQAAWSGNLYVMTEGTTRVLMIEKGTLKGAQSSHDDDRLGQVLYRAGLLTRAQLDDFAYSQDRRFGQLLVEQNLLSQEQLFGHLGKQVEHIFFSSLLSDAGQYAFVVQEALETPIHTVHMPLNMLLLEGVQRMDEMALFRAKIPGDDWVPEIVPRQSMAPADKNTQLVLMYVDGERSVEDIARETGLGIFLTSKILYALVQERSLNLRPGRTLNAEHVVYLVQQFNAILRDIFMAVAAYGGVKSTRANLIQWVLGGDYVRLFGETLDEDGAVNIATVLTNMDAVSEHFDNPMEALLRAFHEMLAFALFSATSCLPRDQELSLARDVHQRVKNINSAK